MSFSAGVYGMDMFVGGRRTPAFDVALVASLGELNAVVIDRATFVDRHQQHAWAAGRDLPAAQLRGQPAELPTLRIADCGGYLALHIRGPRSPLWHLGLARRLSARLGVWAGAMVEDRLQDDYGYGVFFAGHVVELATRTVLRPVMMSRATLELGNGSSGLFFAAADAIGGIGDRPSLVGEGPVDVLGLAAADGGSLHDYDDRTEETSATARGWLDIALPPPMTRAVIVAAGDAHVAVARSLAGWELRVADDIAIVLEARGRAPLHELLVGFEPLEVQATVLRVGGPSTVAHAWTKEDNLAWVHRIVGDARGVASAYLLTRRALRWDCR